LVKNHTKDRYVLPIKDDHQSGLKKIKFESANEKGTQEAPINGNERGEV